MDMDMDMDMCIFDELSKKKKILVNIFYCEGKDNSDVFIFDLIKKGPHFY